jgi:hypothetical protein
MTPLPIVAAYSFAQPAPDAPDDLRSQIRALAPAAPRRVNRLAELGLVGAHRCVAGQGLAADTPLYLAVAGGSVADAITLVAAVVRGQPPMPLSFINVSSNMAGFYIAASLALQSANHVVACADFAFEAALELATLSGARRFLLGAVEEAAWPLAEHRRRLGLSADAAILEGSHWLQIDRDAPAPRAQLQWLRRFSDLDAAARFLRAQYWPAATSWSAGPGLAAQAEAETLLPLPRVPAAAGHSDLHAAAACCGFAAGTEAGARVYVNCGANGDAVYALCVSRA